MEVVKNILSQDYVNLIKAVNDTLLREVNNPDLQKAAVAFLANMAIEINNKDLLKTVLSNYPFAVSLYNENGYTPLHVAAFMGNIEFIEILIDAGADPNMPSIPSSDTPLHLVAAFYNENFLKVWKLLVKAGADLYIENVAKVTPMSRMLKHGLTAEIINDLDQLFQ